MNGRVYHIGLPKTGTTSIQFLTQDKSYYCGVRQPRGKSKSSTAYQEITNFLLGRCPLPPPQLPDKFFYSEEMILVNSIEGMAESNLNRLFSILRPQDKVVVTTRDLESLRVSAYYEFYRFFVGLEIAEVRCHPLLRPFNQDFFDSTIHTEHVSKIVFSKLEDNHSELGKLLDFNLAVALKSQPKRNARKQSSNKVQVQIGTEEIFPKWLSIADSVINPITWRLSKSLPQNFFSSKSRALYHEIPRLNENQIAELVDGTANFNGL